ncbi:MAG: hypothetical protein HY808_14975, partial [Nitrospirae bacterium]|nr:hypothetical protein [Nitrospirota bacterium]
MNNSKKVVLISSFLVMMFMAVTAMAYTEVSSITASPNPFNNINGETTTITVEATSGVTDLEIRALSSDESTVIRSGLNLTEISSGVYTTIWNGRDNNNAIVLAGSYKVRVFNLATTTYIGASSTINVQGLLPASPNPFTPTGTNATTITVQATPGQAGLVAKVRYVSGYYYYYENISL